MGLEVAEHAEHTPGTSNHLIDRCVFNQLESIYTDYVTDNILISIINADSFRGNIEIQFYISLSPAQDIQKICLT